MKLGSYLVLIFILLKFSMGSAQKIEQVATGVYKISLGEVDTFTPEKFRDSAPKEEVLRQLGGADLPFALSHVKITVNDRGVVIAIPLAGEEQLYGFGLQMGSFRQNGLRKMPIVNDYPLNNLGYTHAPAPYYVSNAGYAVLVNTSRYTTFYCGNNQPKRSEKSILKDDSAVKLSVDELYASQEQVSQDNVLVDVPGAKGVEVYFFVGPHMNQAVQRYNLYSGGGAMPPVWGLGVKYRVKADFDQDQVQEMAGYFRENDIPINVIGLEPKWQTNAYPCSFVWNGDLFPEPLSMVQNLKDDGFYINLWEHAFVSGNSPLYDLLRDRSGDYLGFNGLVPDFADASTREVFAGYHQDELVEMGVSGFKMDECDNSDLRFGQARWSFPELSQFPSGIDGEQMHQLFGLLYQKTIYDIYKRLNKRTYLDVRSSNAFASPYPAVLYSDTYDHKEYIELICNSAFSGLLWSPEVRESSSFRELARRSQTAILSAQTLYNSWYLEYPAWLQYDKEKNNRGELLPEGKENEGVIRELLNFRMRLIPYLYNAFYQYQSTGKPVFRPLVMDYPQDENVFEMADEYMIGESLLAAPITGDDDTRKIYLPEGVWYDYNTDEKYEGGKTYEIAFALNEVPVFVKENTILPLAAPLEYVGEDTIFEITCNIYGNPSGPFYLFEDDGVTFDYQAGAFNHIKLMYKNGKVKMSREGNFKKKKYILNKIVKKTTES